MQVSDAVVAGARRKQVPVDMPRARNVRHQQTSRPRLQWGQAERRQLTGSRHAGRHRAPEGQRCQRGVAARAAAVDAQPLRVRQPLGVGEIAGREDARSAVHVSPDASAEQQLTAACSGSSWNNCSATTFQHSATSLPGQCTWSKRAKKERRSAPWARIEGGALPAPGYY